MATLQDIHAEAYSDMPFDDFAKRYHQKFYADMPYSEFATKAGIGGDAPKVEAPKVGVGEDVAKSAVSGLAKGAMNTAGAVGDARDFVSWGAGYAAKALGATPETAQNVESAAGLLGRLNPIAMFAPTSQQVREAVTPFTGESYKPQTTAGKYASSAAEFIPGAVVAPGGAVRNAVTGVAAGLGSELAGQMTEGTKGEPFARVAGAVAGGAAPGIASRAITPLQIAPERMAAVKALEAEGVPLTAGQKTGYRPLQWAEATLGDMPGAGGKAAQVQREQAKAFTAAALRRVGEEADSATPEVMKAAKERIGGMFESVMPKATVSMDEAFAKKIGDAVTEYTRTTIPGQRPRLPDDVANSIVDFAQNQRGVIYGDQLKSLRSELTRYSTTNPELQKFLGKVRAALDDLVIRGAGPEVAKEAATARNQWRNMKLLEEAVGGAGENAAQGLISPQMLRSVVSRGNDKAQYVRGHGDFADLARAGNIAMPQLPQSGTQPRTYIQGMATGGGIMTGDPVTAALGLLGPALTGRALMSGPVQGYLGNQLVPNIQSKFGLLSSPERRLLDQVLRTRAALPPPPQPSQSH